MSETVPEGWTAKTIGDNLVTLTDYTANGSFAALKENVTYYNELNYAALVRTTDLEKQEFEPQRFTDKQGFEFLSKSTLYENDIVVANVGSAGKAYKVPKCSIPMTLAPNMYLVKFNAEKVDSNFAFQVLIWDETIRQLKKNLGITTLSAINKSAFRQLPFLTPPLPEQKKIASILTSVDEVIENTQKQIDKLQDLKKATMNELLTKGIGHTEFKDSELGRIPKSWEMKKLSDCLEIMTDYVANGSFQSLRENVNVKDKVDYALYVRLFDIRKGIIHQSQKYVDKNSYNFLKKSSLHGDEILIANIGAYVGEVHLMPKLNKPATLAPNMILLRVLKKYDYKFLYYFLSSDLGQKIIYFSIAGSGQEKLNKTDLKKIKIVLPPLEEQVKISEIIIKIEQNIHLIKKKSSKYNLIKKSLMQDLLTGKVRVQVN